MKTPKIINAVGCIDDRLVSDAIDSKNSKKKNPIKWLAAAACLAVAVVGAAGLLQLLENFSKHTDTPDADRYVDTYCRELSIEWPWEYKSISEKYTSLELNGRTYHGKSEKVSDMYVGEIIGPVTVSGYDLTTSARHAEQFEAYRLLNLPEETFAAVKMDNDYYVFMSDAYNPEKTLGELIAHNNLSKCIQLYTYSEKDDEKAYKLADGEHIWELLSACGDAEFVEDLSFNTYDRTGIYFSITSEELGIKKHSLCITEDGYLCTNAFEWQYLYFIGEKAAGEIISYARENSVEVSPEPFEDFCLGVITEITDDYIIIDDSALCKDKKAGRTYKILLDDICVSRYVKLDLISLGDIIRVSYDAANDNDTGTISTVYSISKCFISGGEAVSPE